MADHFPRALSWLRIDFSVSLDTPETFFRRGFFLTAAGDALRAPAAMMARPRFKDTPAPFAALAAAASNPICFVRLTPFALTVS